MTKEQLKRIIDHVNQGHLVKRDTCYVDGFLNVWEEEEEWFYSSDVWARSPLKELEIEELSFYQPLEF